MYILAALLGSQKNLSTILCKSLHLVREFSIGLLLSPKIGHNVKLAVCFVYILTQVTYIHDLQKRNL